MKLTKEQRELLAGWVAEGLDAVEINARAANIDRPFYVSAQMIDWYRQKQSDSIQALIKNTEPKDGLANKAERVNLLKELALRIAVDLFDGDNLWIEDLTSRKPNIDEINLLRDLLDDIARELGERKGTSAVNMESDTVVIYVPDNARYTKN